ncbi:MAG: lamin tail domain-containing protein, partial [Sedimentisphaerales bacterium]|nr:lamin tail domain-containing protein [Sedimentisphaerales bacterium]
MHRPRDFLVCAIALSSFFACSVYGACPVGDVHQDADCQVNWLDLRDFANQWLSGGCAAPACRADLDGVPGVTMKDYAILADNWMAEGTYTLVINEFMADNAGTIEDPDESDEYADWFEIYNYGNEDIDIGGMYVKDDTTWWRIPTGYALQTTVKAHGHLLLWADNDPEQGPLHVDFALGRGSDQIGIYDAFKYPIDVVSFTNQIQDRSRGRLPDGSSNWITFDIGSATPGATNRGKPVKVVINEIMYHPGHAINTPENIAEEYIELYNNGEESVALQGWRFTNGIDYTITDDVIIGVGGYYVIAADVNAFKAKYPAVTNVVGGWTGHLSNSGETVELVDNTGVLVDKLQYSDQGDWAVRYLGPVDRAHRGWEWSDAHDGGGDSLELINPDVPNEYGQNWAASQTDGGTPGSLNTISDSDIAPLILDVEHWPIIPGPNDAVKVTAQILDELSSGVSVRLHYRVDRSVYTGNESIYPHYDADDYNDVPMFDDGAHGDDAAADGLYGAQIPAYAHGTIVEFFVEAEDAATNTRTWPAPSSIDGTPEQVTNMLYQVDETFDSQTWVAGEQPIYFIIMTNMERARLEDIVRNHSNLEGPNSQMNATFISADGVDIKVRYIVGVRNRGHGTRNDWPNNYHVNFVHGSPWKDVTAINLNTAYPYLQFAGSAVFRLSGIGQAEAAAVQVRTNGRNLAVPDVQMYNSYVHNEAVDNDFAANHFPGDGEGNAYKAMRVTHQADLRYEGALPDPYRQNYFKETNASADDWSDLINLCNVLSNTPDSSYVEAVNNVIDAEQWLRLIAVNVLLSNAETTLANGNGDDYYLYRGFNNTRFVLVQHDLDSIFGIGQNPGSTSADIFLVANVPTMNRFVRHPEFVPRYYYHLKNLIETTFSPEQINPFLDELLGDYVAPGTIQQMKDFVVQRNAYVLSRIPSDLTVVSDLSQVSGYYTTDVDVAILYGEADAVKTRSVLVNGYHAIWYPVQGEWTVAEPQEPDYDSLVDRGARWKYFDEYTDLGSDWYVDVDDTGWAEGDAELGYGDGTETTPIGYLVTNPGTPEEGKNITTYFTHSFNVADVSKYSALSLRIRRDDGAVVYLNEQEIARSNMPEGTVGYTTQAASNVYGTDSGGSDVETLYYGGRIYDNDDDFTNIDIGYLQNGENVLAVEIHQYQINGSDISFDLELMGILKGSGPTIGTPLNPGINHIIVQTFDGPNGTGNEIDREHVDIWYNDGDESTISGTLAIDRT